MVNDVSNKGSGASASKRRELTSAIVLVLMLLIIAAEVAGFILTNSEQSQATNIRENTRHARITQQALVEANATIYAYLLGGSPAALDAFYRARRQAQHVGRIVTSEASVREDLLRRVAELDRRWQQHLVSSRGGDLTPAQLATVWTSSDVPLRTAKASFEAFLEDQNTRGRALEAQIASSRAWILIIQLIGGAIGLTGLAFAFRAGAAEARARNRAAEDAVAAREQVESLFQMADLLQSASGYDDANAVLSATASRLLPEFGGTLYVFNNSRDRLDRSAVWNHAEPEALPEFVLPSSCWAVKRGKWHLNCGAEASLRCEHHQGTRAVLEMPMMARGELYGLLSFSLMGEDAKQRLMEAHNIAAALADAMSLALANIGLRERLRNQAIKDPLTGLYNRRYMEDMLERLIGLAERSGRPFSLIMIDLDHFKHLNDEHGHAAGDAALQRASEALIGSLRETDVGCRYGGEELVVLLPDCSLDDALLKAESLRARIEGSGDATLRVTASLGVATIPETSSSAVSLVAMADAALYEAKKAGRNRVKAAMRAVVPQSALLAAE